VTGSASDSDCAERALNAVSDLIADAGPAPEGIVSAHGENLLVQTDHGFQMDSSRLWVQVEGTAAIDSYRSEGGGYSLAIPFEQALRWVRTLDLVLMVLWDVVEDVGWYALPVSQVDPIGGISSGQRTIAIRFDEDDVLTKEAVDSLVWRSRLEHFRLLALSARDAQAQREEREGSGKKKRSNPHERVLTAMDFTDLLEITERRLEPGGMKYKIRDEALDEFELILATAPENPYTEEGLEHLQAKIACEVVRRRWKRIEPKLDLPSVLVEEGAEVILHPIRQLEEDPATMQAVIERAARNG
jgi:hypothetical protein